MPKKQNTTAQRAREAARQGTRYTRALRNGAGYRPAAGTTAIVGEDDRFGGHEFEYEQVTDLFRCTGCRVYEVVARDTDGPIKPCTGLIGYGGDTERVYLLLTENPELPHSHVASWRGTSATPASAVRHGTHGGTGSCWSSRLPASSPNWPAGSNRSRPAVDSRQVPAVSPVDHLTAEAGRAILAENYAAYVAEYGEPA